MHTLYFDFMKYFNVVGEKQDSVYKQVAAVLTANSRIAGAFYRITFAHAGYSSYFIISWEIPPQKNAPSRAGRSCPHLIHGSLVSPEFIFQTTPRSIQPCFEAHSCDQQSSAFRQPSPTCRTAFPAQHLRPSGVLSCWTDGLELTTGFHPGSNEQHRLF